MHAEKASLEELTQYLHMNGFNDMEGKKVFDEVSHFDFWSS